MENGIIGLAAGTVVHLPNNPAWTVLFVREAARLTDVFGDEMVSVDHFGSSSISTIKSKPVIDILVQVKSDVLSDALIERLKLNDYYEVVFEDGIQRRMFGKNKDGKRLYNVHVLKYGHAFARGMLAFRDLLRAHPQIARGYEALKLQLAIQFPTDRKAYFEAKKIFIDRYEANDWQPLQQDQLAK